MNLEKINKALDITNAFIWEGSARCYLNKDSTDALLKLDIHGTSEIEHSGDIQGIHNQVADLENQSIVLDNIKYTISRADILDINSMDSNNDGDQTIQIKGQVLIKIKSLTNEHTN